MKENSPGCYHQLWRRQSKIVKLFVHCELAARALVSKENGRIAVHF
jgi:hypothetical protein